MIYPLAFFFILGSAVGSFLNVFCDRTFRKETLLGRSYCDHCRAKLSFIDLIPLLSFVGLRAKCRFCKKPISCQYPLVEAACGLLFVLSFYTLISSGRFTIFELLLHLVLISILIVVFMIDLKFYLIPTSLVFFASFLVLFYNYFFLSSNDFISHVFTASILALVFIAIVLVTFGRGMGVGDIPLAFLIGLVLGWPQTYAAIFLAFAIGALVSVSLLFTHRKKLGQTVPFGPFLVLGFLLTLFWGTQIINWYLSFF